MLVDELSVVLFFIEKEEPKNSLTQGKLPHPHFSQILARSLLLMVFLSIEILLKKQILFFVCESKLELFILIFLLGIDVFDRRQIFYR